MLNIYKEQFASNDNILQFRIILKSITIYIL